MLGVRTLLIDGKYRLEERLGEGAVGRVYRALHLGLHKRFALKLLQPAGAADPVAVARFRREAEALGRLKHPHIVAVTDFGIDPETGAPYLVMEELAGRSLADRLLQEGPLPLARALPLLAAAASAVDAAHAAGILHRDLKPANLFLEETAGEARLQVLDFGLAELAGRREERSSQPPEAAGLTATGELAGTPLYAAPEVVRQEGASRASDLYSFAALAYEVLTGRPPFQGTVAEVLCGHLEREVPAAPGLAPEILAALRTAMSKDPAARPATAGAWVASLRLAAESASRAHWRTVELPRRLGITALLTAALTALGFLLPGASIPPLERRAYDLWMAAAPAASPDPRLLLVEIDEASLQENPRPLGDPAWAAAVGRGIETLFAAGARGVAIDILLHASWSGSDEFQRTLLAHPDALVLAAYTDPETRTVLGAGCLSPWSVAVLGQQRAAALFAYTNLEADPDGTVRRGRLRYRTRGGASPPSWAGRVAEQMTGRLAGPDGGFRIDFRIDERRFERIAWKDVASAVQQQPERFRDRYVLLGGTYSGSGDLHRVPPRPYRQDVLAGLDLQALMVNTLVAERPLADAGPALSALAVALATGAGSAGALATRRAGPAIAFLASALALPLAAASLAFAFSGTVVPVSLPCLLGLLGFGLAWLVRWRRLRWQPPILALGVALLLGIVPAPSAAAGPGTPVALVCELNGVAKRFSGGKWQPVRLFDLLPAGTVVRAEPTSALVFAFRSGQRFRLGPRARVTLARDGFANRAGPVEPLPPLPPLVLQPILQPGARSGAPRSFGAAAIRNRGLGGLYPGRGAVAVSDATVLRFEPLASASKYRVEITDGEGRLVFQQETAAAGIEVPAGVLRPGARYRWSVRSLDAVGPKAEGAESFQTLPRPMSRARGELRTLLVARPEALAFLGEVDRRLGLWLEARESFREALRHDPGEPVILAALAEVDTHFREEGP